MSKKIDASKYIAMYGPTVGDKVRLADTNLFVEVEKDYTYYGDECKFGGGKSLRDGMGQSANCTSKDGALDLVITNALIIDYWGIVKADIGIKDGMIVGIGKAGNPDIMDGVDPSYGSWSLNRCTISRRCNSYSWWYRYTYSLYMSTTSRHSIV